MGLGNPGPEHGKTRHNVGRWVVEALSQRWSIGWRRHLGQARVAEGQVHHQPVTLATPETFMNASGEAVQGLLKETGVPLDSVLVVCDDVALPLGMIRLRAQGSEGGHLGLASVLERVGTGAVPRLRVGIRGETLGAADLADYVLDAFEPSELPQLQQGLDRALEACELWVKEGLTAAMNRFNQRVP